MKAPRQILFEQHRPAEARLNAVRRKALASIPVTAGQKSRGVDLGSVRALLFSLRWHLAGMTAVWLLVMFLNSEQPATLVQVSAKEKTRFPQQLLIALRENRRQIQQLMESGATSEPALPVLPPRRSELQTTNTFA